MSPEEKKPEEGGVAGETKAGFCDCDYRTLVGVFKALSDESRQKILLALEEEGEMRVADLVERLHISQPTMSHHLGVLRNSGLVNDRRSGQSIFYSVNSRWLSDCCGGYLSHFDGDED